MGFGWEGDKIRLVPLDEDKHLENALRWLNDPEVTEWLLIGDMPLTRIHEREYFKSHASPGSEIAFAVETLAGEHVGFSGLHDINFRHGTAISGTIIGRRDLWNQGMGTDVVRVRARYCFDVLGLRLLMSEYLEGNVASAKMQAKAGYQVSGRVPKRWWKRGAYRDGIKTYLDRDMWLALNKR